MLETALAFLLLTHSKETSALANAVTPSSVPSRQIINFPQCQAPLSLRLSRFCHITHGNLTRTVTPLGSLGGGVGRVGREQPLFGLSFLISKMKELNKLITNIAYLYDYVSMLLFQWHAMLLMENHYEKISNSKFFFKRTKLLEFYILYLLVINGVTLSI